MIVADLSHLAQTRKPRTPDLLGQRFGKLTIRAFAGYKRHKAIWHARCDCGTEIIVKANAALSGNTTSCGCITREGRHKACHTGAYATWVGIRQRCENPKNCNYSRYGGRGIKVCERWQSFENFYADMGDRPNEKSIDRLDPNGDYSPENCRWATRAEQARTRRSNVKATIDGKTMCVIDWCAEKGIDYPRTMWWRRVLGLSAEEAISKEEARCPRPSGWWGRRRYGTEVA